MLKVTIELIPFGDELKAEKIGELLIANNRQGGYEAWTDADSWSGEPAKYGHLVEHDRKESVWELLRLLLEVIRLEKQKVPKQKDSVAQKLFRRLSSNKTTGSKTT